MVSATKLDYKIIQNNKIDLIKYLSVLFTNFGEILLLDVDHKQMFLMLRLG